MIIEEAKSITGTQEILRLKDIDTWEITFLSRDTQTSNILPTDNIATLEFKTTQALLNFDTGMRGSTTISIIADI